MCDVIDFFASSQIQDFQHQQFVGELERYFPSIHLYCSYCERCAFNSYPALKRVMETEGMELEIIINPKTTDDGQAVIQVRFFRRSLQRGEYSD